LSKLNPSEASVTPLDIAFVLTVTLPFVFIVIINLFVVNLDGNIFQLTLPSIGKNKFVDGLN
jgi:hypothetical protein